MYTTLINIAKKYSVSQSYIKKYELVEGVHFIFIGKMKRYNIEEMHNLLVSKVQSQVKTNPILNRFLLES